MGLAATLAAAAGQSADDLAGRFSAGRLRIDLQQFCSDNINLFPESQPESHPVSNWFVVVFAITANIPFGHTATIPQLITATNGLYRLLWMADFLQSVGQISTDQGDTVLASYNTLIAFP